MDIVQNSLRAKSTMIHISVKESTNSNLLEIEVKDNGIGMDETTLKNISNPFFSTKDNSKIGLGIPLFKMATEQTGGNFYVMSNPQKGTTVTARFITSSINIKPLGDINSLISSLIFINPQVDFVFYREHNGKSFILDTRELRQTLVDISLDNIKVIQWVKNFLNENTKIIMEEQHNEIFS